MTLKSNGLRMAGMVLVGVLGLDLGGTLKAQEPTGPALSRRGGTIASAEGHRFEVFFYPTGVRLFLLDAAGNPVDASRLTGHATFFHPNAPDKPWFSRPLQPDMTTPEHLPASLVVSVGLESAPRNGVVVDFEVIGLESKTSSTAEFKVPLRFLSASATRPATRPVARLVEPVPAETRVAGAQPGYVAAPATVPQPAYVPYAYAPGSYVGAVAGGTYSGGNFIESHRDWTTGRINYPLAKPWLQETYGAR